VVTIDTGKLGNVTNAVAVGGRGSVRGVEGGDRVVRIRVNVEGESPLMIKLT